MLLCSTTSVTSKCGNSVAKCFVQLLQLMQQVWQQELKYVGQKCAKVYCRVDAAGVATSVACKWVKSVAKVYCAPRTVQ